MTVLILFSTIEGQTGKIAHFISDEVKKAGHEVRLVDASDPNAQLSFDDVDRVILAAPVHERRHPNDFEVTLAGNVERLKTCRTLLISVSLAAAFPDGLEDAEDYLTELKMRTHFTPDAEALVAGAVRPGSYDYFASQVVRYVVLRDRSYEPTPGETKEFTDWAKLAATVSDFL